MTRTNARPKLAASLFIALALGFSVVYWLLFVLRDRGAISLDGLVGPLGVARGYGPALAALIVAWLTMGRAGLRELGARLTCWRLPPWLYGVALLMPALAAGSVVAIVARGAPERLALGEVNPLRLIVIFFVFAVIDGPLGEEIGWRGFLLPRLLEWMRPLAASLLIGAVWFLWHLPLYAAQGDRIMDVSFLWLYLLLNVAYAVLHTWLFLRSNGSAWLAVFFHTAGNYFVYLSLSLFPGLRGVDSVRAWHTAAISMFALLAAISLSRRADRRDQR